MIILTMCITDWCIGSSNSVGCHSNSNSRTSNILTLFNSVCCSSWSAIEVIVAAPLVIIM